MANRDPEARYNNKVTDAELGELLSNLNLDRYFTGIGTGRQEYVIVSQPSYMTALNELFPEIPVSDVERISAVCRHYAATPTFSPATSTIHTSTFTLKP